jgi:hypothetical protein
MCIQGRANLGLDVKSFVFVSMGCHCGGEGDGRLQVEVVYKRVEVRRVLELSSSIKQLTTATYSFDLLTTKPRACSTTIYHNTIMLFPTMLSLLAVAGLTTASPLVPRQTPCPVAPTPSGDYATNNGTLDFQCAASADPVEDATFYKCGENSFIEFAWQDERGGLMLRQNVSDE